MIKIIFENHYTLTDKYGGFNSAVKIINCKNKEGFVVHAQSHNAINIVCGFTGVSLNDIYSVNLCTDLVHVKSLPRQTFDLKYDQCKIDGNWIKGLKAIGLRKAKNGNT